MKDIKQIIKTEAGWREVDRGNYPEVKYHELVNDTFPIGEVVMAYLQWQFSVSGENWINASDVDYNRCGFKFSTYSHENKSIYTRQIWVAANQSNQEGFNPQFSSSNPTRGDQEGKEEQAKDFQSRVLDWLIKCFGAEIAKDILERNDRFIEESLELAQSLNYSADRAHALVDYVFNRDKGEPFQEVGGVMVTLAALCSATGLNMALDGETEFARINKPEIIEKIRKKQASKPTGSALPIPLEQESISNLSDVSQCDAIIKKLNKYNERYNHGLIVQAMHEYATLKTSSLQQENDKLREALELARQWIDGEPACQYTIEVIDNALNKKP